MGEDVNKYTNGSIAHIDGKTIEESDLLRYKNQYDGSWVYVNPSITSMHPSQVGPTHADLLIHRHDERMKKVGPSGLTREELAKNGLGEPDFF